MPEKIWYVMHWDGRLIPDNFIISYHAYIYYFSITSSAVTRARRARHLLWSHKSQWVPKIENDQFLYMFIFWWKLHSDFQIGSRSPALNVIPLSHLTCSSRWHKMTICVDVPLTTDRPTHCTVTSRYCGWPSLLISDFGLVFCSSLGLVTY